MYCIKIEKRMKLVHPHKLNLSKSISYYSIKLIIISLSFSLNDPEIAFKDCVIEYFTLLGASPYDSAISLIDN